jgi:Flp pilus assembly protein TadG
MVEFAMVLPVFLIMVLGAVDYGGYFAARLSVENAARAAVRDAAVQACPTIESNGVEAGNNACWTNQNPAGSTTIEAAAIAAANGANVTNVDCPDSHGAWPPSAADLATLPPDTGCISIRYYDLNTSAQTCTVVNGNVVPGTCQLTLCASWSAATDELTAASTSFILGTNCLIPASSSGANIVQVLVGYNFQPLTPMPAMLGSVMTTTAAESQLILERP